MVKVKEDMTGWKMWEHGVPDSRLTVIRQTEDYIKPNGKHEAKWLCECSCENHTRIEAVGSNIRDGSTKSCGCLKAEKIIESCKKYNQYDLSGEYGICYASNTNNESYFDLEDYDLIKNYCWYECGSTGYMQTRTPNNEWIYMHRLITKNKYKIVDHINRNKLDNRKVNLRDATKRINILNREGVISTNTSGYTGVYFNDQRQKWESQICINNKTKHLGSYKNKDDAIIVRLKAEKKYYGEFAPQRHLFEEYGIT